MRQPSKIIPKASAETDWRIPQQSVKYVDALPLVPKDGQWYVLTEGFGMTTGEQTARALNHPGSLYVYGYRVYAENGVLVSALAVRYVKP